MRDKKSRRAVSPVIATVILVAVAITIAVAVSYWMGGISSQYTRFEKVEVTSSYCEYEANLLTAGWPATNFTGTDSGWVITMDFRNTGTTDASIIDVFVNSKKAKAYGQDTSAPLADLISAWEAKNDQLFVTGNEKLICEPGTEDTIYVIIQDATGISFTSGTTVEVALHSGAGNTYMKMVTLS